MKMEFSLPPRKASSKPSSREGLPVRQARLWQWTIFLFAPALVSFGASGVFRERVIPRASAGATSVVGGPDSGFWFTEFDANRIGTFSQDGQYREFVVPTPDSGPYGITTDSASIWFTELKAGKIGRLTLDGVFTEYVIPTPQSAPWGIAAVSSTNGFSMWFTESAANKIGYI